LDATVTKCKELTEKTKEFEKFFEMTRNENEEIKTLNEKLNISEETIKEQIKNEKKEKWE